MVMGGAASTFINVPSILIVCSDQHRFDYYLGSRGAELMPALHELARKVHKDRQDPMASA